MQTQLTKCARWLLPLLLLGNSSAHAGAIFPIKEWECINGWSFDGWSVGEQYRDSNNGVPSDKWSMLVRWQGPVTGSTFVSQYLNYDMGSLTGIFGGAQRGRLPQNGVDSPGVQVNCADVGMVLNSWATPHRPVVGGGYNDMWGYKWSPQNQVRPFTNGNELVLQGNLQVTGFHPYGEYAHGGVHFFAYLRDTTSDLPPIAVLGTAYSSNFTANDLVNGYLSFDYTEGNTTGALETADFMSAKANQAFPSWNIPPSSTGVWFAVGPISMSAANTQPYVTTRQTTGQLTAPLQTGAWVYPLEFWRIHITPENMAAIVNGINSQPCLGPPNCPERISQGSKYSSRMSDYALEYGGVIAETTVRDYLVNPTKLDLSYDNWVFADASKSQVGMSVRVNGFSFFGFDEYRPDEETVERLYTGILNRAADPPGYGYWLNSIRDGRCGDDGSNSLLLQRLDYVSAAFVWSTEFLARGLSNGEFVTALYRGLLHREPDQYGLSYWTAQLDASSMNWEQVRVAVVYSAEFQSNTRDRIRNGACI